MRGTLIGFGFMVLFAGGLALPTHAAGPKVPGESLSVKLEVLSKEGAPIELSLTMTKEHRCASLEDEQASTKREIVVCREGGTAELPILSLRLAETEGGQRALKRRFTLASELPRGERVALGRYAQAGAVTEIFATAR
jgi:hypothetical protein